MSNKVIVITGASGGIRAAECGDATLPVVADATRRTEVQRVLDYLSALSSDE